MMILRRMLIEDDNLIENIKFDEGKFPSKHQKDLNREYRIKSRGDRGVFNLSNEMQGSSKFS